MQLHRFDLNLLVALDTLLQERNVTRASERLFISQPAMSSALNKLRTYFGDQLLVRVGREMELTPRAISLVEPVREALLKIHATLGHQPDFIPASAQREFSIIVTEEAVPDLLPEILRRINAAAPGIRCHIELVGHDSLTKLERGDADLCLVLDNLRLYETSAYPDSLFSTRLRKVEWVVAVDRNHPTVSGEFSLEHFYALPQIVGRPGGYSATGDELLRRLLNVEVQVHLTVPSLLQLPLMLAGTTYFATLPERIARLMRSTAPLSTFPVPVPVPTQHEILLWHRRHDLDPAHMWLRNLIADAAQACP
jgi:hypothetical protein